MKTNVYTLFHDDLKSQLDLTNTQILTITKFLKDKGLLDYDLLKEIYLYDE